MLQAGLYVASDGAVGSVLRGWVMIWLARLCPGSPRLAAWIGIAGALSSMMPGMGARALHRFVLPMQWRAAFIVGICASFTTFASFSAQATFHAGTPTRMLLKVGVSMLLCLLAAAIGHLLADHVRRAGEVNVR